MRGFIYLISPRRKKSHKRGMLIQKGERGTMGKKYSPQGAQRSAEIANGPHIKIAAFLREPLWMAPFYFQPRGALFTRYVSLVFTPREHKEPPQLNNRGEIPTPIRGRTRPQAAKHDPSLIRATRSTKCCMGNEEVVTRTGEGISRERCYLFPPILLLRLHPFTLKDTLQICYTYSIVTHTMIIQML